MESKVICFSLFDPVNSVFKEKANEKASCRIISCSNSERCDAFKKGECTFKNNIFGESCPYGFVETQIGYSKRSKKYHRWISGKKEEFGHITGVESSKNNIFNCGDYVVFNYPHWYLDFPREEYSGTAFGSSKRYIKKEHFNISFLSMVIKRKPKAMFGGEITSYRQEIVPKILLALKSYDQSIYNDLLEQNPVISEIAESISYVGKMVKANSLKIGCFYTFKVGKAKWDGERFIFENPKIFLPPLKGDIDMSIKPKPNEHLKIQDSDQVGDDTVFV